MRALVIEDSAEISECIEASLHGMGIASDCFDNGHMGLSAASSVDYDMLILDLNLPDADGLDILKSLRSNGLDTPVLIISARVDIEDRVKGLDSGADDYLVKPFNLDELEARIRALLRRQQEVRNTEISFGPLMFDQTSRQFLIDGEVLDLPPRERSVLEVLIRKQDTIMSKERIAEHIFNFDEKASYTSIEIYISRLRSKLKTSGISIYSRQGLGYALQLA